MTVTLKAALKTWIVAYMPPCLWAGFIFFLSSQGILPSLELGTADFVFKKLSHMFVYAVLYYLLWRAVKLSIPGPARHIHWVLPIILTFSYAISDELHQNFVPGRYGTLRDIGYDMLGTSIVFLWQYRYI